MEGTVNTRQFAIIVFIIAVSSKIFMLPALIMGISGRDSWLTIIMYFFVELMVLLFIVLASKKNPTASVYELLEAFVGKVLTKIILFVVIFFYLFKVTVMISEIKVFFVITATESLSWQLCIIPLLVVFGLMSLKTLRGIVRASEITLPLICLSFIILGLIMAKNTDFTNLLPVFENGAKKTFDSFRLLPIWLTDFSVLIIFIGRVENKKKLKMASFIAAALAFALVLYFNLVMFSTYSYVPNLLDYGHNVTNMLLYPTGTYNYGRVDLVIFSVWMLGIMIHIALLFYVMCRHLTRASKIRNNYVTALIIGTILFIFINNIFPDELKLYSYSVSLFNYFAFAIEVFLPLLVFVASIVYKNKCLKKKVFLDGNLSIQ